MIYRVERRYCVSTSPLPFESYDCNGDSISK